MEIEKNVIMDCTFQCPCLCCKDVLKVRPRQPLHVIHYCDVYSRTLKEVPIQIQIQIILFYIELKTIKH